MPNKSYTVIIRIDFNTIDCPGVWLCPKGKALLKVCLFGIADLTKDVDPFFPLVIRERFIFEKNFRDVSSVYELHDKIGRSLISIELLQCPVGSPGCVKLAIFNSLLSDLLHPYSSCFEKPQDTSGIELLFTTCKIFPGIIAPKADVSLKVAVSDMRGVGSKPTVRRVPLKLRKGDAKRQQAVCHSKNGLNCCCFSRSRAHTREQDQPDFDEGGGDAVQTEQSVFAGRGAAHVLSTDHRPKTSQFYPTPPPRLTSQFQGHQGQYRTNASQKPIRPLLGGKKNSLSTHQDAKYEDEPDMDWARVNLGVAFGPGEYRGNDKDQTTHFSGGWEHIWDGGNKRGKRRTILSARRSEFQDRAATADDKLEYRMSGREGEYGDEAISREMEECDKLLKEYKLDDVKNDPELKSKYENCVKSIDWLRKYGDESNSSDKLMTVTSMEEQLVATQRHPVVVPRHGECCKCKEEQVGTGQGPSIEHEEQIHRARRARNRDLLSPIDENSEWFPRKKWETERQREVLKRQKEQFRGSQRVILEQEQRSRQPWESDRSDGPDQYGKDEQERRRRERERRRQQEIIRQRVQRERMSRQRRDSSSDQERVVPNQPGPIGDTDQRSRPSEAPRNEPPKAERRAYSPDGNPKPSTEAAQPPRPSTTPHGGQDQTNSGPSTKTKPTPPQQPKISDAATPQTVQQRAQGPRKSPPDEGDPPVEDCDCDICGQYQELYNPISHPCPRFRKNAKKNSGQTPPKHTWTGARKLIASRKNGSGPSKKHDRRAVEECGFSYCDGPIDTEAIEEMNAIKKFYYGK